MALNNERFLPGPGECSPEPGRKRFLCQMEPFNEQQPGEAVDGREERIILLLTVMYISCKL